MFGGTCGILAVLATALWVGGAARAVMVAHEINTPVQFVTDSIQFVREAMPDLLHVVDTLGAVMRELEARVLVGAT